MKRSSIIAICSNPLVQNEGREAGYLGFNQRLLKELARLEIAKQRAASTHNRNPDKTVTLSFALTSSAINPQCKAHRTDGP
jgi:hypothetical protein